MKKKLAGGAVALLVLGLGLIGCATPLRSPGEALDAVGISRAKEFQFYARSGFQLILMRSANDQTDPTAKISKGVPSYTRQTISIPARAPCVVVNEETTEEGRLVLTVAFEKDETRTLSFVQTTDDLRYFTSFALLLEGDPENPIVKYGDAYYEVSSYNLVQTGRQVTLERTHPTLGIQEKMKNNITFVAGRKR
jgi:hypothetical protein